MIDFLLMLLAGIGLSHILVDGSILEPFKQKLKDWNFTWLSKLFSCYQCSGWWSGLIVFGLTLLAQEWFWVKGILVAFAVSYLSMLAAVIIIHFNSGGQSNGQE